ncbi:hypothetical protein E2C01_062340 [Portunus trituberculatus]|uniref:Uncharacterized protein n=1 Tax=Portunus trituberculatus TaxID=210409 RepID=A0A5B7HDD1_PORTR|nr:hypothetical protein [Portunus trituberculatus]
MTQPFNTSNLITMATMSPYVFMDTMLGAVPTRSTVGTHNIMKISNSSSKGTSTIDATFPLCCINY